MSIALLTLEEHRSGIWVTLLIDKLRVALPEESIHVITLESTLTCVSNPFPVGTIAVINRVSDAAKLYKETVALLECCEHVWGLKVWNGGSIYAMVANKWCHTALLERAGLKTPKTQRLHYSCGETTTTPSSSSSQKITCSTSSCNVESIMSSFSFPLLFKPNAGGFGAGIMKVDSQEQSLPSTHDNMAILQQYIPPYKNELFRIWFLRGKVQCALIRQNLDGVNEFTNGCAANGACSLQDRDNKLPRLFAFQIPVGIRSEIEDQLLPMMKAAHSGSVEYLFDQDNNHYYFDINLLSTLPLKEHTENWSEVWGEMYDPWTELANSIVDFVYEV